MRNRRLYIGWFWSALALVSLAVTADDKLVIYTEEFPPYNFAAADGTIGGSATGNVRQVMDATGIAYEIRLVPWTRAMHAATADTNALIYTLARTPSRQDLFD